MVPYGRSLARVATLGLIIAALGTPRSVAAAPPAGPDKQACVNAATRGQIQRDDQQLRSAAEAFEICSQESCPAQVRQSCTQWLVEVRALYPTLTIHVDPAKLGGGPVTVRVDGVTRDLDRAVEIEPGLHQVEVEAKGKLPLQQDVAVKAGEKKVFEPRLLDPPPAPRRGRPIPLSVWISGGVAAAGLATFGVFGAMAKSDVDTLKETCAPGCSESDKDGAFSTAVVADVGLVVGLLGAAAATYFFLSRPTKTLPPGAASLVFTGSAARATF